MSVLRLSLAALVLLTITASAQPAPDGTGSGSDAAGSAAEPPLTRAEVEAIVAAHQPPPPPAPLPPPPPVLHPWNDGFWITNDNGFKLRVGAILQYDGRFFVDENDADKHVDQFAFRSTRLVLAGTLYDHFDIKFMPDFAGGKLVVQDAYFDVHYTNVFKLRFGKTKVPFGLERLQEEFATTFTERGLPTLVAPNRDLGIVAFGELGQGTVTYQAGIFNGVGDGQSGDGDVSDDKEGAARVFVRPFAKGPEVVKELGFGGAATYGEKHGHLASPDVGSFKTPGQTTFFQFKTGTTTSDTVFADGRHWRATAQGYWYTGPIGLLAEYVRSRQHIVLGTSHEIADVESWQVVGQWVITGDKATYKSVTPVHPFDPKKHQWGAVDVAARIGELRIVDEGTLDNGFADPNKSARRAWSAGVGTDWFLNRNIRFILDVDRTWYTRGFKPGDRPEETSLIGRAQAAF